jgi:hypothetical protein
LASGCRRREIAELPYSPSWRVNAGRMRDASFKNRR